MAKAIMIQGTGSGVGKSLIVAGLCRIFANEGFKVAPFKSQNMSLNSFVTSCGGEIARAQAVQAAAAKTNPVVEMNPILLKPTRDKEAQVIVLGKVYRNMTATEYQESKRKAFRIVAEAFEWLAQEYDLIVIEGAGSPAEINLMAEDIANMKIAALAKAPVLLVGDIDKGGVFASLIGTLDLLPASYRSFIKGFIINKFRGEKRLLLPGLEFLEKQTSIPVIGVIPYLRDITIEEEDSLAQSYFGTCDRKAIDIAVINLPHISNFTDFDPLKLEDKLVLRYVSNSQKLGRPDVVIIPGSKNVLDDLIFLHESGLAQQIRILAKEGQLVMGICGGYQMLGKVVYDSLGIESNQQQVEGLGLLPVETEITPVKVTAQVVAEVVAEQGFLATLQGQKVTGYEIHMGKSIIQGKGAPVFKINERNQTSVEVEDGAINKTGNVIGTYLHGLFENTNLRQAFISYLASLGSKPVSEEINDYHFFREEQFNLLAGVLKENLKMDFIYELVKGEEKLCGGRQSLLF